MRARILYVHNSADLYGASRSLLRLLRVLDRNRFEPLVVVPENGPLVSKLRELEVEIFVLTNLTIITRDVFHSWRLIPFFLNVPRSVLALWRLIKRRRINVVHTNTGVVIAAALAARLAGVPHIWHIRDSFQEFSATWRIYSAFIQGISDRVIAVSDAVARQFQGSTKVEVIHNGLPPDEFAFDRPLLRHEFRAAWKILPERIVVSCIGRIKLIRKGQENLIAALDLLKARGMEVTCMIVGSTSPGNESHLTQLKAQVKNAALDNVVFTGELADPQSVYAASDLVVLPSALPEPFGGVVLEAMANGLPVIATNIGGSPEQVTDGVTGFLVPPADPRALADKLAVLIENAQLRARMGMAAKERIASTFPLSETKERLEAIYTSLLAKNAPGEAMRPYNRPATMHDRLREMSVGFYLADQNLGRDRSRGITAYAVALLTALSRHPDLHLSLKTSLSACSPEIAGASVSVLPFRTDSIGLRVIADQLHPLWNSDAVNLWHYPKGFLPAFLKPRKPVIGTVCDTYIQFHADHYPEYRNKWDYAYWLHMLRSSIARFDAIITISECSRRAIVELCDRYKIHCPPITVTYLAVDWEIARNAPAPKEDFVLHLASPEPNKQTDRLLNYWSRLAKVRKDLPELKLVGNMTQEQSALLATILRASHLRPLPQKELRALMQSARALLLPSEIEGFGLPALEAYNAGTPVHYVRDTAVHEVLGAHTPGAFALTDFDSFQTTLAEVLSLSFERVSAIRKNLAATYSWERCAQETIRVYERFV